MQKSRSETYLLGHQKYLRCGSDIVALDYEAKNMTLGLGWRVLFVAQHCWKIGWCRDKGGW